MSRRIARPYAAALYQVLARLGTPVLHEAENQLQAASELFEGHPEVLRVFEVPTVTTATKRELLAAIARALSLRVETHRLLTALSQHFRLRFLAEVARSFRDLVDRQEGMVRGSVVLPVPPEHGQVERLAATLAAALERRVELETRIDDGLLGGFVVQLGSRVFDGSLRTRLKRFAAAAGAR